LTFLTHKITNQTQRFDVLLICNEGIEMKKLKDMKDLKKIGLALGTLVLGMFLMIACNNNDTPGITDGNGKVNILLTDAPFPVDLVSQTIVTIDKIEIRKQGNDTTDASFITLMEESADFDLLTLSNGITAELASVELETGTYDQIRMHVTDSKVILTDGTEYDLKIPSGSSSGLKIKIEPEINISSGQTFDVLLDFDVSKSFVAKGNWKGGNINGFNFKPVVRCVLLDMAGRIEGTVVDTSNVALESTAVNLWMEVDSLASDSLLTTAFTDADGYYRLIGIPEGTYYMTAQLDSFLTDTILGVSVAKGESTQVDFILTPEPE